MAELWQSYGSWIIYGLVFLVFLWLHSRMHGHGHGHGGHNSHGSHGHVEPGTRAELDQLGPEGNPPGHAHGGDKAGEAPRRRKGCC